MKERNENLFPMKKKLQKSRMRITFVSSTNKVTTTSFYTLCFQTLINQHFVSLLNLGVNGALVMVLKSIYGGIMVSSFLGVPMFWEEQHCCLENGTYK